MKGAVQGRFQALTQWAGDLLDAEAPANGPPPKELRAFMGWCLSGAWPVIALATLVSVISGATEVISMYLLGQVVDAAAGPVFDGFFAEHWGILTFAIVLLIGVRPILFGLLALTQSVILGPNIFKQTLARLHRWTLGQAVTFFDNDFAGRIAQKQNQVARSLTEVVIETVNAVAFSLASVIGAGILLITIDARLLLILGLWFASYVLFLRMMLPRVRARAKRRAASQAMVSGQIVDTITNIKTVKLFAGSTHEDSAALGAMEDLRGHGIAFGELSTAFRLGLIFLAGILPLGMVGMAIALRGSGVTAGDIAAIGAVSIRLAQMTGWISFTLMAIYAHIGEVEDGMRTLTPRHTLIDAKGAVDLQLKQADIRFDGVTFAYGGDTGGIHDISLSIAHGEKVGIVGASGAGKSTLVNLLLRLYDAESGRIEVSGQDIAGLTQESLRRHIGMVSQETAMFNRTARDNILYGRPDATDDELINAATRAEAHGFIADLRDNRGRKGYDAFLGERGVKLSGGQRQRIALARALLKDAPILVLDEATSALDSEVEASIQAALDRAMEGKTVLAIAHRLSTIASMDRIIVMDAGRIVEEGTHDDLLERQGLYARYWSRQSGGFLRAVEAAE